MHVDMHGEWFVLLLELLLSMADIGCIICRSCGEAVECTTSAKSVEHTLECKLYVVEFYCC